MGLRRGPGILTIFGLTTHQISTPIMAANRKPLYMMMAESNIASYSLRPSPMVSRCTTPTMP